MKYVKRNIALVFTVLLMGNHPSASGDMVMTEMFAIEGESDVLLSEHMLSGESRWDATANLHISKNGGSGYICVKNGSPFAARVEIPNQGKIISIDANVAPVSADGSPNWVSIGMGASAIPASIKEHWPHGFFLLLSSAGTYEFQLDPGDGAALAMIKNGPAPRFVSGGDNSLRMEYEKSEKTVSVYINGICVIQAQPVLENAGSVTLEPTHAGFSGHGQASDISIISKFELSISE